MNLIPPLLAFLAGATLAMQVVVNSQARTHLKIDGASLHPMQAALINFGGGTILLLIICALGRFPWPTLAAIRPAPWWLWTGGALGIVYVSSAALLGQRLGVTLFFALVITGQMVGSLLIDQFGICGAPIKTLNLGRVLGVGLVLAGMMVVMFATQGSTAE